MSGALTLIRKLLADARAMLLIMAGAMFLFGWLNVYVTWLTMNRFRNQMGPERTRLLRQMAGDNAELSTAAFEMRFWMHPFLWLPVVVWGISRGSLAVAGELERGSMDLILSRPISRTSYLGSQVLVAILGILFLVGALVAGNLVGTRFNPIEDPPTWRLLLKPAANLSALGLTVYGYTLFLSAIERVRWRPMLVASVVTIASFVGWFIAVLPVMDTSPWKPWLLKSSIFNAYNPVDAVVRAEQLAGNLAILSTIGLVGVILAFGGFLWRDLPSSG